MKRILTEPLLHFVLLGAGLFLAYGLMSNSDRSGEPGKIVVTQGQIEHLAAGFTKVWQRPPTEQELAGLVRDWVREEVYCREALALSLDKGDLVVRRRLRQKMEFISQDLMTQTEPSDEELGAYLRSHPESFRGEERFTFRHVYFNPARHGENLANDAAQLLERLNGSGESVDPAALGDTFLLGHEFTGVSSTEVAMQFGPEFTAKLSAAGLGEWQGPIESGYGFHLVLVARRSEGRLPALEEVREAVRREWENARRLEANEELYQQLLSRYTVEFEGLEPIDRQSQVAEARR